MADRKQKNNGIIAEAYFMENDTQKNEEKLEMLLMKFEEVRHGICLF